MSQGWKPQGGVAVVSQPENRGGMEFVELYIAPAIIQNK
ncbi:hypothetical protein CKO31_02450 [Thiohalocapsa halophila]|uniref:DUF1737 domain-containing protein n=1 Tax=Thiohalocapsa halophila TaxID=69359 RepID=A0ABS1CCH7_9GAMM|nr:hypothetical protein [Thiohalocapsa halophila]